MGYKKGIAIGNSLLNTGLSLSQSIRRTDMNKRESKRFDREEEDAKRLSNARRIAMEEWETENSGGNQTKTGPTGPPNRDSRLTDQGMKSPQPITAEDADTRFIVAVLKADLKLRHMGIKEKSLALGKKKFAGDIKVLQSRLDTIDEKDTDAIEQLFIDTQRTSFTGYTNVEKGSQGTFLGTGYDGKKVTKPLPPPKEQLHMIARMLDLNSDKMYTAYFKYREDVNQKALLAAKTVENTKTGRFGQRTTGGIDAQTGGNSAPTLTTWDENGNETITKDFNPTEWVESTPQTKDKKDQAKGKKDQATATLDLTNQQKNTSEARAALYGAQAAGLGGKNTEEKEKNDATWVKNVLTEIGKDQQLSVELGLPEDKTPAYQAIRKIVGLMAPARGEMNHATAATEATELYKSIVASVEKEMGPAPEEGTMEFADHESEKNSKINEQIGNMLSPNEGKHGGQPGSADNVNQPAADPPKAVAKFYIGEIMKSGAATNPSTIERIAKKIEKEYSEKYGPEYGREAAYEFRTYFQGSNNEANRQSKMNLRGPAPLSGINRQFAGIAALGGNSPQPSTPTAPTTPRKGIFPGGINFLNRGTSQ